MPQSRMVPDVLTGADGSYCFMDLPAGTYQVHFEGSPLEQTGLDVTQKNACENDCDSDADGVYSENVLTSAQIVGIVLPTLEEIRANDALQWELTCLDAGFRLPVPTQPTQPSNPEVENPRTEDPTALIPRR